MRIVAISDTHTMHKQLELPEADMIIHAGDFLNTGKYHDLHDFSKWWNELDYKHKVIIPGNHDRCLAWKPELSRMLDGHYLVDELVTIEGIKIYGDPWTPAVPNPTLPWEFCLTRNGEKLAEKVSSIPDGIDILLTHGPPMGYRDYFRGQRVGCEHLVIELMREDKVQPKYNIFGHVHADYGEARLGDIKLFNVSNWDDLTRGVLEPKRTPPTLFDYEVGIPLL